MEKNTAINNDIAAETDRMETAGRTALIGSDTRELTKEFTLPDYIPDVRKVVSSGARAKTEETERNENSIGWECCVIFDALLLCEDGTIREVSLEGRQEGEVRIDGEAEDVRLETAIENAGMRATDPRKLTGRCRICVSAVGTERAECTPDITGVPSGGAALEEKKENVGYTVISCCKKEDIRASCDIELGSSDSEIKDIVSCKVRPYITSVRINDGLADLSGEAAIELIYSAPDGSYHTHRSSLPISAVCEGDLARSSGAWAQARADEIKAAAQTNAYGEQKIVELDFSWDAEVLCASDEQCEIITDVYSTEDELETESGKLRLDVLTAAFTDRFSVKGESTAEDLSLTRAQSLDAYTAEAAIDGVTLKEGEGAEFNGTVYVRLICGVSDRAEGCVTGEMKIPFSYFRKADGVRKDSRYRACVEITGIRVRLEGGRAAAEADLCLSAMIWSPVEREMITRAAATGESVEKRPPLTLYYLGEGEDVWDIAKSFRVPVDSILDRNGITYDGLKNKKVIAIPG